MGIPKFFRWLSERYPLINQTIDSHTLAPDFDNLYLDMNGIIHNCTHPEDKDLTAQLSEKEMVLNIFHYIDRLFQLIKPRKLFYLAVDGVAPRAKLNQQRQRRFRSAKEAREAIEAAKDKGIQVPEDKFDSNCITPGTEFMYRLSKYLKFFIRKKIQEDSSWRRCKVIFSGQEIPGEGEHKIMEYIRLMKSQPDYDPNTSHCLYGLDADLIMLSLTTHEPHTALLREEVLTKEGRNKSKIDTSMKFHLLHLSMVREYLELEFRTESLPFPFDLERVIDDFVLMCFFIGNDFLPSLPGLDIAEGSLNNMFDMYRELLPEMGGYLTDGSNINLNRLEMFVAKIASKERSMFEYISFNMDRFEKIALGETDEEVPLSRSAEIQMKNMERDLNSIGVSMSDFDDEEDDTWKNYYYRDKFKVPITRTDVINDICTSYIQGVLWVLNYYHNGCISWNWFYPYHYAPLASDLKNLSSLQIKFETAQPFTPYHQLLAVLPRESVRCLPKAYHWLMLDHSSPIADFYPSEFEIDMNGKKNAWEGIVCVPFIDQNRLLEAAALVPQSQLSKEEKIRNEFGSAYIFEWDPKNSSHCVSPMPDVFGDITSCFATQREYSLPPYPEGRHLGFKLLKGTKLGVDSPWGFPTLKTLPFTHEAKYLNVNIFGNNSRRDSLLIKLNGAKFVPARDRDELSAQASKEEALEEASRRQLQLEQAKRLIGQKVFVDWPFFKEVLVVGVSSQEGKWNNSNFTPFKGDEIGYWKKDSDYAHETLILKRALEVGPIHVMLHVKMFQGFEETHEGRKKKWTQEEDSFPFQTMLPSLRVLDPRLKETGPLPIHEAFPVGQEVLFLGTPFYGSKAKVLAVEGQRLQLSVEVCPYPPTFGREIAYNCRERYYKLSYVARSLQISSLTLSRLTGDLFFEPGRVNLGMSMKFSGKNLQVLGYTRQVTVYPNNGNPSFSNRGPQLVWEFSEKAVQLIKEYYQKFPEVWRAVDNNPNASSFKIHDLVQEESKSEEKKEVPALEDEVGVIKQHADEDDDVNNVDIPEPDFEEAEDEVERLLKEAKSKTAKYVAEVKTWLKTTGIYKMQRVPTGSSGMTPDAIKLVEQEAAKFSAYLSKSSKSKTLHNIDPRYVLKAVDNPLPFQDRFALGDRAVIATDGVRIPFGTHGTVVTLKGDTADIILDTEFIGAGHLHRNCSDLRGLSLPLNRIINLSNPSYRTIGGGGKASLRASQDSFRQHFVKAAQATTDSSQSQVTAQQSYATTQTTDVQAHVAQSFVPKKILGKQEQFPVTSITATPVVSPPVVTTSTTEEEEPHVSQSTTKSKSSDSVRVKKKTSPQPSAKGKSHNQVKYVVKSSKQETDDTQFNLSVSPASPSLTFSPLSVSSSSISPQASPSSISSSQSPVLSPNSSTDDFDPAAYWESLQQQHQKPPAATSVAYSVQHQPLYQLPPMTQHAVPQMSMQLSAHTGVLQPNVLQQMTPFEALTQQLFMNQQMQYSSVQEQLLVPTEQPAASKDQLNWQQQELLKGNQGRQHTNKKNDNRHRGYNNNNGNNGNNYQQGRRKSDHGQKKSHSFKSKSGEALSWQQRELLKKSY